MRIRDEFPVGSGTGQPAHAPGAPEGTWRGRRLADPVRRAANWGKRRYAGSSAEYLWQRLESVDFINQGMLFAATLLLSFFPFLIVGAAVTGRDFADSLARYTGLNRQAAIDLDHLFAATARTHDVVVGVTSGVFFVLGGIAAAGALQLLYERAFGVDHRGAGVVRRLSWLVLFCGAVLLGDWAGPELHNVGGPALLAAAALLGYLGFWWLSMWVLLAGRVSWRRLFPSACATAVLWLAAGVVFSFFFSDMVISQYQEYGPIGMIFAVMTYLIVIGVVVVAGAIVGLVWHERGMSFAAAARKLRWTR